MNASSRESAAAPTSVPPLLASHGTLAGAADERDVSPQPLTDRIAAAARAGFSGIGIGYDDLVFWADRLSAAEISRSFADHGLRYLEIESLLEWWRDPADDRGATAGRDELLRRAGELGIADTLVKLGFAWQPGTDQTMEAYAERLPVVADQLTAAGMRFALEFMPFGEVNNLRRAMDIIERSGRTDVGVCADIWHITRGGVALDELAALPSLHLAHVELGDGGAEPVGSLMEDTMDHRAPCGDGEFDVTGFIRSVRATGYNGPWGIEILSVEQRELSLDEAAVRAFDTTARAFEHV